jgi:hypothetical protein
MYKIMSKKNTGNKNNFFKISDLFMFWNPKKQVGGPVNQ